MLNERMLPGEEDALVGSAGSGSFCSPVGMRC